MYGKNKQGMKFVTNQCWINWRKNNRPWEVIGRGKISDDEFEMPWWHSMMTSRKKVGVWIWNTGERWETGDICYMSWSNKNGDFTYGKNVEQEDRKYKPGNSKNMNGLWKKRSQWERLRKDQRSWREGFHVKKAKGAFNKKSGL